MYLSVGRTSFALCNRDRVHVTACRSLDVVDAAIFEWKGEIKERWTNATKVLDEVRSELKDQCVQYAEQSGYDPPRGTQRKRKAGDNEFRLQRPSKRAQVPMVLDSEDEEEDEAVGGPSGSGSKKGRGEEVTPWVKGDLPVDLRDQVRREVDDFDKERSLFAGTPTLEYWHNARHRFPMLSAVARFTLCVPASSATSERSFSKTGHIMRVRRRRLSSEHLKELTFLSWNPDLMH